MKIELRHLTTSSDIKRAMALDDFREYIITEPLETWEPNLAVTDYFLVFKDDMPYGFLAAERFCSNALVFHGGVIKAQRRKGTPKILRCILDELKRLSGGKVIMTSISVKNEKVIALVKQMGFIEKCIINNASRVGDMMILVEA